MMEKSEVSGHDNVRSSSANPRNGGQQYELQEQTKQTRQCPTEIDGIVDLEKQSQSSEGGTAEGPPKEPDLVSEALEPGSHG